jgi:TctA family transporter
MKKHEKISNLTTHLPTKSIINAIFSDQIFFQQQKKNVYLLMLSFLLESVFVFIWDLLCESIWSKDLDCSDDFIVSYNILINFFERYKESEN